MTSTPWRPSLPRLHDSDSFQAVADAGPLRLAAVVLGTILVGLALGAADPFGRLTLWLTRGGDDTRVQPQMLTPDAWDPSFGDGLLDTLSKHRPFPQDADSILVFGNSQQFTISLARGQAAHPGKSPVAADLFIDKLNAATPGRYVMFNGAAANQMFPEALWQAIYWFDVAPDRPRTLLIQSSFDTFRKVGIRPGYQSLLTAPQFSDDRYGAVSKNLNT